MNGSIMDTFYPGSPIQPSNHRKRKIMIIKHICGDNYFSFFARGGYIQEPSLTKGSSIQEPSLTKSYEVLQNLTKGYTTWRCLIFGRPAHFQLPHPFLCISVHFRAFPCISMHCHAFPCIFVHFCAFPRQQQNRSRLAKTWSQITCGPLVHSFN